ncbi:MAG: hypothetical protein AAGK32_05465, partial [Actinomycetota bacterium]
SCASTSDTSDTDELSARDTAAIVDGVIDKFEILDLAFPGHESPEAAAARAAGAGVPKKKRRWGRRRRG